MLREVCKLLYDVLQASEAIWGILQNNLPDLHSQIKKMLNK